MCLRERKLLHQASIDSSVEIYLRVMNSETHSPREMKKWIWWYECEKSTGKYTLPETLSSPVMKTALTIYICWQGEKMYSQSHSDTQEN